MNKILIVMIIITSLVTLAIIYIIHDVSLGMGIMGLCISWCALGKESVSSSSKES